MNHLLKLKVRFIMNEDEISKSGKCALFVCRAEGGNFELEFQFTLQCVVQLQLPTSVTFDTRCHFYCLVFFFVFLWIVLFLFYAAVCSATSTPNKCHIWHCCYSYCLLFFVCIFVDCFVLILCCSVQCNCSSEQVSHLTRLLFLYSFHCLLSIVCFYLFNCKRSFNLTDHFHYFPCSFNGLVIEM